MISWSTLEGVGCSQRVGPRVGVPTATRPIVGTAVLQVNVAVEGVSDVTRRSVGAPGGAGGGGGVVVVGGGAVVVDGTVVVGAVVVLVVGVAGRAARSS
jgi:hypothetical protein